VWLMLEGIIEQPGWSMWGVTEQLP
jgi:hypothetical protein